MAQLFITALFPIPSRNRFLSGINRSYRRAQGFLLTANRLILTLGTAFVFVYRVPYGRGGDQLPQAAG